MRDILKLHEAESQRIIDVSENPVAGTIAGQHHNYNQQAVTYPHSTSTLRVAEKLARHKLASVLQIVDISDTFRHGRNYLEAKGELSILTELVSETNAGKLDSDVSYPWINTTFQKIIIDSKKSTDSLIDSDDYTQVQSFLTTLASDTKAVSLV